MADEADIENVKDLLPSEADWPDEKIGVYLDADKTVYEVVQTYWESRMAKLTTMIDINESGSSRSLSRLYDNAKGQAEYWAARVAAVKAEEEAAEDDGRIKFNTIKRI